MTCSKCSCEYDQRINILCPQCGCKKIEEFCKEPFEATKMVLDMFGTEILADHRKFCSAFSDVAPKLSKANKSFSVALSEHAGDIYLNALKQSDINTEEINNKAYILISEYLNDEKSKMVINSISFALGWCDYPDVPDENSESGDKYNSNAFIADLFRHAENGDVNAQFELGFCFATGEGIECNDEKAFYWYNRAVERGDIDAINNLAGCYFKGKGAEKNYTKAAELYLKAAEHGLARAQYNYGECCYNGYGVNQNYSEAVLWYTKSASQLDPDAQYSLGWCYIKGEGVKCDYDAAKRFFELSAQQRNPNAQIMLAYCYMNGQGTERNYAKASDWFNKAAVRGSKEAAKMLVKCLKMGGYYLAADVDKAYKLSAKFGIDFDEV